MCAVPIIWYGHLWRTALVAKEDRYRDQAKKLSSAAAMSALGHNMAQS